MESLTWHMTHIKKNIGEPVGSLSAHRDQINVRFGLTAAVRSIAACSSKAPWTPYADGPKPTLVATAGKVRLEPEADTWRVTEFIKSNRSNTSAYR